jgi:AbiV family abortive infection protein
MVKKSLDQYKGRLSPQQIAAGTNAAVRNATRLVDDANLLLERKRFPSAAALAILAIEEAGKAAILRQMAVVQDDPKELKDCRRDYRSHTKKNVAWPAPQMFAMGARSLDVFYPLFEEDSDHPFILDQVKQIGFYTDCLGNANWSSPPDVIDEDLAGILFHTARLLVDNPEVTPTEIALWVKHMKPHMGSGMVANYDGAKRAVRDWYADMQETGLSAHSTENIEAFLDDSSGGG